MKEAEKKRGCKLEKRLTFLGNRCFYIWLLPLLWSFFAIMSFLYPGDEHICFGCGTFIAWWIFFLYQFNSLESALLPILVTGAVTIALFGFLIDWLKVGKIMFFILLFIAAGFLFLKNVSLFESLEQIRWKHRSVLAVVFMTCNQSSYASIILSIIGNRIKRVWQRLKYQSQGNC